MRNLRSLLSPVFLYLICSTPAWSQQITTVDAPGAGSGAGQGTVAFVVISSGAVVGEYIDADGAYHGFVRAPQGSYTVFDAPGAGTGPGQGTQPVSANARGEITGWYVDSSNASHGFVRAPDGAIVTFDAPGAGNGGCSPLIICANGTQGASINAAGTIAGQFVDDSGVFHGFVRSPGGVIQRFDAPNAGTSPGQGTFVVFVDGINPDGAIAGGYADAGGAFHGLVRAPDGTVTTYDIPAATFTDNSGITPNGTVMSWYLDLNSVAHGYVRSPDGTFTFFDVPGAGTGSGQGTIAENVNTKGDITGQYVDANGLNHGFLRYASGAITSFDVPGAGTGSGQGTIPIYNNAADAICGFYFDAVGAIHGFLRAAPGGTDR